MMTRIPKYSNINKVKLKEALYLQRQKKNKSFSPLVLPVLHPFFATFFVQLDTSFSQILSPSSIPSSANLTPDKPET